MGAYNCCCAQPRKPEDLLGKLTPIKLPESTPQAANPNSRRSMLSSDEESS